MLHIGCHLSASKGYLAMGKDAVKIHADTFQFFTRNPRGGKAKEIDENDIAAFLKLAEEQRFTTILAHAPYTMNACSKDAGIRGFSREMMADDLRRMEYLPGNFYNFHPGSHVGQGTDTGISLITEQLNAVMNPEQHTTVLLETMAGKGSEVGGRFEELRRIMDGVHLSEKLGVCLDTCHVYDAGYDIVNHLDDVLDEFDSVIGLEHLKAVHLNDSMNSAGSHKDRHAKIGEGSLGFEAICRIINHPKLQHLFFILETPHDTLEGYGAEIALLRSCHQEG
ncbi:MAG: deoxyribonuclease IV [Peptococcaceae bacterium]|nr:deoxyribonuclease IV [Peptococcaceae bacterium]